MKTKSNRWFSNESMHSSRSTKVDRRECEGWVTDPPTKDNLLISEQTQKVVQKLRTKYL